MKKTLIALITLATVTSIQATVIITDTFSNAGADVQLSDGTSNKGYLTYENDMLAHTSTNGWSYINYTGSAVGKTLLTASIDLKGTAAGDQYKIGILGDNSAITTDKLLELVDVSELTWSHFDFVCNLSGSEVTYDDSTSTIAHNTLDIWKDGVLLTTSDTTVDVGAISKVWFAVTSDAPGTTETILVDNLEFRDTAYVVAIPEPATFGLLGLGAIGLLAMRRKMNR